MINRVSALKASNPFSQIVVRLRAAFIAIAVLMLVSIVLVGNEMKSLDQFQKAVIFDSIPTLQRSHQFEGILDEMLILHEEIQANGRLDLIDVAEDRVSSLRDQILEITEPVSKKY